jgi:hypothetical protein
MQRIALSKGFFALVDDEDFERLSGRAWHATVKNDHTVYARSAGEKMHRLVLGIAPDDPREPDHRDGDGLNNQKANLRIATKAQNQANRGPFKGRRFKGVYWHKGGSKWAATITFENVRRHLGLFRTEEDAARAYNEAARITHGEFARLNDV